MAIEKYESSVGFGGRQSNLTTASTIDGFVAGVEGGLDEVRPSKSLIPLNGTGERGHAFLQEGKGHVEGSYSWKLFPNCDITQRLLANFMGAVDSNNTVTGDAATGYNHKFVLTNEKATQGGITVQQYMGSNKGDHFLGCYLNSYNMTAAEGAVTLETGIQGVKMLSPAPTFGSPPSVLFTQPERPFDSAKGMIKLGTAGNIASAVDIKASAFGVSLSNALSFDLGGEFPDYFSIARYKAEITATIILDDNRSLYNDWKNSVNKSCEIILSHDTQAGSSSGNYQFSYRFPEVVLLGDPVGIDGGDGTYKMEVKMEAKTATVGADTYFIEIDALDKTSGTFSG